MADLENDRSRAVSQWSAAALSRVFASSPLEDPRRLRGKGLRLLLVHDCAKTVTDEFSTPTSLRKAFLEVFVLL
jgi:hypothetical protein